MGLKKEFKKSVSGKPIRGNQKGVKRMARRKWPKVDRGRKGARNGGKDSRIGVKECQSARMVSKGRLQG